MRLGDSRFNFFRFSVIRSIAVAWCVLNTSNAFATGEKACNEVGVVPFCLDAACAEDVCDFNPNCCQIVWDQSCVDMADSRCSGCHVNLQDCRLPHLLGGCKDSTCCELVCAIDPYCCQTSWDGACVIYATDCPAPPPVACGDATAGNCKQVHGTPSCQDAACCELVCSNPGTAYCCNESWDEVCVSLANSLCNTECVGPAPIGAIFESEACGNDQNDPGIRVSGKSGLPQQISSAGVVLEGQLFGTGASALTDIDVYSIDLRNSDTDHDGLVKVRLAIKGSIPIFCALVTPTTTASGLPTAPLLVSADACTQEQSYSCVAPAIWNIVVAPGSGGVIQDRVISCVSGERAYRLWVQVDADCGAACGASTDSCFIAHSGTSCSSAACCVQVCSVRPLCCDTGWDALCVQSASDTCVLPVVANDLCANATVASVGEQFFSLIGSGLETTPEISCRSTTAATGSDVWFQWSPTAAGLYVVSVCGVEFDSRLVVYHGSCGAMTSVACSDNSTSCQPNTNGSQTLVSVQCGENYLIRIASVVGQTGAGNLSITPSLLGAACCAADLDHSTTVDFGDVTFALLDYGPCQQCPADLDNSGEVDFGDITLILLEIGPCP